MFLQQGPKLFFECHLAMTNFLARNRRDNRLVHLAPFQGELCRIDALARIESIVCTPVPLQLAIGGQ
jgi:hypothetical protein